MWANTDRNRTNERASQHTKKQIAEAKMANWRSLSPRAQSKLFKLMRTREICSDKTQSHNFYSLNVTTITVDTAYNHRMKYTWTPISKMNTINSFSTMNRNFWIQCSFMRMSFFHRHHEMIVIASKSAQGPTITHIVFETKMPDRISSQFEEKELMPDYKTENWLEPKKILFWHFVNTHRALKIKMKTSL